MVNRVCFQLKGEKLFYLIVIKNLLSIDLLGGQNTKII